MGGDDDDDDDDDGKSPHYHGLHGPVLQLLAQEEVAHWWQYYLDVSLQVGGRGGEWKTLGWGGSSTPPYSTINYSLSLSV